MSDNWAMDLAREEQVLYSSPESSQFSTVEWNSSSSFSSLTPPGSLKYEEEYVEQQQHVQENKRSVRKECDHVCNDNSPGSYSEESLKEERHAKQHIGRSGYSTRQIQHRDWKRLKKNKKQREREKEKKDLLKKIKDILVKRLNPKVRGSRLLTEYQTLHLARKCIEYIRQSYT